MRNTCFWRREVHHCLHYGNIGTLSPHYGSAEMKSLWGIFVFEEQKFTTVSITGTLVHSHPFTDQLKWSHYEEYLFLKNRSSPLSPLWELSTLVHFHTVTDQLKWSHNEEYLVLKKRCSPLSPLQELRYTLSPCYGSAEMKLRWRLLVFEKEIYISGASVHFHHIMNQLKWSYNEH